MKKKVLLLILICSHSILLAQNIVESDSIRLSKYNLESREFENFNSARFLTEKDFGHLTLGNFGQTDLLLNQVDIRLNPSRFSPAAFLADNPTLIKSNKTFSQIAFSNTFNDGALFRAAVARPISKNWLASIVFDRNNAVGQYQRESVSSNFANFSVGRLNDSLDFQLFASGNLGTLKRQVSGGIASQEVFEANAVTNRELMAVNLSSAQQKLNLVDINMSAPYTIYKSKDSLAEVKHAIIPNIRFKKSYFLYTDSDPASGYYQSIHLDSLSTYDSISFQRLSGGLDYCFTSNKDHMQIGLGWHNETSFQRYSGNQKWMELKASGEKHLGSGRLFVKSSINLGKVKAHYINVEFQQPLNEDYCLKLSLGNSLERLTPYLIKYKGNHVSWNSEWLNPKSTFWTIGLEKDESKYLRLGYKQFTSRLFFGVNEVLTQSSKMEGLWQVSTKWDWDLSKFNFAIEAIALPNVASQKQISLPEATVSSTLTYSNNIFKGALPFKIGAQLNGFSNYLASSYNPSLNIFYLQEDFTTPFYPYLDLFVVLQVKSAFLKIQFEHLSQGITSYNYYINSTYTRPDRTLLFSVRWNFIN